MATHDVALAVAAKASGLHGQPKYPFAEGSST